jgi:hypothetical protein
MLPPVDLRAALESLLAALGRERIEYALIGGLALASHGAGRATQDLDLLVDGNRSEDVARVMSELGYRPLHRSRDAANYVSEDASKGRVDFLFAIRTHARGMLSRASPHAGLERASIRVVEVEDLIGLKVQASSNNPSRRFADLSDIQRLLQANPDADLGRVREYFRIFEREKELEDLLSTLERS